MKKIIRNGNVGILFSPRYGAGWYSWNTDVKQCLFSPEIIELVEAKRQSEITDEFCQKLFNVRSFFSGGAHDLEIKWLPEGTAFTVNEYDGSESIETLDTLTLTA